MALIRQERRSLKLVACAPDGSAPVLPSPDAATSAGGSAYQTHILLPPMSGSWLVCLVASSCARSAPFALTRGQTGRVLSLDSDTVAPGHAVTHLREHANVLPAINARRYVSR